MPVSHGTSHTVSVVWVQAVLTPPGHVETAAHGAHGALPHADQVEPGRHVGIAATAVVLKATLVALDTRLPASSSATTQTVYAVDWFRLGVGETTTDLAMFARTAMLVPFAAEPDTVPALIVEADGTPAAVWFAAVGSTT